MAEAGAEDEDDIGAFLLTGPLGYKWPNRTVLIAKRPTGTKVYRNDPGVAHAEVVFLNDLEETLSNEENNSTIEIYINYSPCNKCSQDILDFLKKHSKVKLKIIFAHVYKGHKVEIRLMLKALEENENITLRAVRGKDWNEIIKLIYNHHELEVPQGDLEEWDVVKDHILEQQFDLEEKLNEANYLQQAFILDFLEEIMAHNHEDWGTELGNRLQIMNKRKLHNVAMQFLYNYGQGSLNEILPVDADNGTGYAYLLRMLNTYPELNEQQRQELLQKRIVADFVAEKEVSYIINEAGQGAAAAH